MGQEIELYHEVVGPKISGTVSVNLEELDRMRAEHAKAVKAYQELYEKRMQVYCTITNRNGYGIDRYRSVQYDVTEHKEYKNLEEVQTLIREEEEERVKEELTRLKHKVTDQAKELSTLNTINKDLQRSNSTVVHNYEVLTKKKEELQKEKKDAEAKIKSLQIARDNQLIIEQGYLSSIKHLKEQVKKLQFKKSFWGSIFN